MIAPEASLLRIYLNAGDRLKGEVLYQVVVERARAAGLAGASVFGTEFCYGIHQRLHDAASEYGFVDAPVVVEIVDATDRLDGFVTELGALVPEGLMTIRPVSVVGDIHPTDRIVSGG